MAEEPQQQRDDRAARKQQLNGHIRPGVTCDLNQCVHDAVTLCPPGAPEIRCILVRGMLSAVRIPLISDHDRFVARLFRVQVNLKLLFPRDKCSAPMTSTLRRKRHMDSEPQR
jgi:hypothetical protein